MQTENTNLSKGLSKQTYRMCIDPNRQTAMVTLSNLLYP